MITTVLLDLDDTILDFHKAEKEAAEKSTAKSWSGANRKIAGEVQ